MKSMIRMRYVVAAVAFMACGLRVNAADMAMPKLPAEGTYPSNVTVSITDKGAVADGKTLCTQAFKDAIDQCAAAGGGIVRVPAGTFLTGPIHLKSKITLQVDEGAVLKFSSDHTLYPLVKTRFECTDIMNFSPLIYAYQCEDIRITGKGTLDGSGKDWWAWKDNKTAYNAIKKYTNDREGKYPLEERVFGEKMLGLRPCFIEPYECKKILIEGVTIRQSPFWNIHPVYSEDVIVRSVTVFGDGANTDGFDPDSCKKVLVENSTFNTGDDCVVIKSGRDADGIRRNAPCEDITIRNCVMNGGHGAITMGSETSAGIRRVFAENCTVNGPDSAIRLKSTRGRGGGIEDVYCRNITVNATKKVAITLDLKYGVKQPKAGAAAASAPTTNEADAVIDDPTKMYAKTETTPVFKNIVIENFTCAGAPEAVTIVGLPESVIENVTLRNVSITAEKGSRAEYVNGLVRENVTINPKKGEAWTLKEVK